MSNSLVPHYIFCCAFLAGSKVRLRDYSILHLGFLKRRNELCFQKYSEGFQGYNGLFGVFCPANYDTTKQQHSNIKYISTSYD